MAMAIPMIMLAGAAISAVGATQSAKAQETAALYNARSDENNALIAADQANADAMRLNRNFLRAKGSMEALRGASGVTEEGSPLSVLADSAANARLDEETILYKGKLRSLGYYNSATLNRMSADTAQEQGAYRSASALLTGVGQAGSTFSLSTGRLRQGPAGGYGSPLLEDMP